MASPADSAQHCGFRFSIARPSEVFAKHFLTEESANDQMVLVEARRRHKYRRFWDHSDDHPASFADRPSPSEDASSHDSLHVA